MGIWREREERDKLMEMLRNRGEEAGARVDCGGRGRGITDLSGAEAEACVCA